MQQLSLFVCTVFAAGSFALCKCVCSLPEAAMWDGQSYLSYSNPAPFALREANYTSNLHPIHLVFSLLGVNSSLQPWTYQSRMDVRAPLTNSSLRIYSVIQGSIWLLSIETDKNERGWHFSYYNSKRSLLLGALQGQSETNLFNSKLTFKSLLMSLHFFKKGYCNRTSNIVLSLWYS